jgi:membrane protein implicated in regulation of membrane protease activity
MMTFSTWSLIWLVLLVLFAVLEAATVSLVSIWFAAGAAAALLVSALTPSRFMQCTIFLLVSVAALAATRPLARKYHVNRRVPTNADRNVGRTATVVVPIEPHVPGRVRLDGVDWAAHADTALPAGTLCTVLSVDGTSLYVTEALCTAH